MIGVNQARQVGVIFIFIFIEVVSLTLLSSVIFKRFTGLDDYVSSPVFRMLAGSTGPSIGFSLCLHKFRRKMKDNRENVAKKKKQEEMTDNQL